MQPHQFFSRREKRKTSLSTGRQTYETRAESVFARGHHAVVRARRRKACGAGRPVRVPKVAGCHGDCGHPDEANEGAWHSAEAQFSGRRHPRSDGRIRLRGGCHGRLATAVGPFFLGFVAAEDGESGAFAVLL